MKYIGYLQFIKNIENEKLKIFKYIIKTENSGLNLMNFLMKKVR